MRYLALATLMVTLTSCADRNRVNCERIRNKAPISVDSTQLGGGRCG